MARSRVSRRSTAFVLSLGAAMLSTGTIESARAVVLTEPPSFGDPLDITNRFFGGFPVGGRKILTGQTGEGADLLAEDLYHPGTRDFLLDGAEVRTRILQESEVEDGELIEVSQNYFAQADDGTVFYFGEVVDEFEDGVVVSHEGSWLVGGPTLPTDPAETATASEPGLFMPAIPEVGDVFKPEDLFPIVDETVTVVAVDQIVDTPFGQFSGAIQVLETTQLGPETEFKWYAPGVGVVRVEASDGEVLALSELSGFAEVPEPTALVLCLSGLIAIGLIGRRSGALRLHRMP